MSEEYVRFLLNSFLLIVLMILIFLVLKKKGNLRLLNGFPNRSISVLDRIFLTRNSQLLLLKVKGSVFLIFAGKENASILKEWKDEEGNFSFSRNSNISPRK